jgi:hypothetical protein
MPEHHVAGHKLRIPLLVALALAASFTVASSSASLGAEGCRVVNVTQNTVGHTFNAMVHAAVDDDHLQVHGTCTGGAVTSADLTIDGFGDAATVTGGGAVRVLKVKQGANVTVRDLSIVRGYAKAGGGIKNFGTLRLVRVVVRRNTAKLGGGIYNAGQLTLVDSRIAYNTASQFGGGINAEGPTRVENSVVRNNTAPDGGGIVTGGGVLVLWRSTVKANSASGNGGGISDWYDDELTFGIEVRLVESHVVSNHAGGNGGGVNVRGGTLTIRSHSTIAGNSSTGHGGGVNLAQALGGEFYGKVSRDGSSSITNNQPDNCYDEETDAACST